MKSSWMPLVLVAAIAGAGGFALGRQTSPEGAPTTTAVALPEPPAPPVMPMAPEDPTPRPEPPEGSIEGTLRDHVEVAQYTYLHLALPSGETWAAVYKQPVKDGDHV